jgi:D-hexose-6-phosphate mutarotase
MTNNRAEHPHISNHLAFACSRFHQSHYDSKCFKELLSLSMNSGFQQTFNYAIYCDEMQVKHNIFIPQFHTYYLVGDAKDVIVMDEGLIDLPAVYPHHKYYIYDNKELFEKFKEKYNDIVHINEIKDILHVQANE